MGALIIIAISFAVYFLPSIVGRNKENSASIILLNLFLGWTFVGWVVALVWATSKDDNTKHYLLKIQAEQRDTLHKISDKNTNISISVSDEIRKLNIKVGETTKDGMFTLKVAECLGSCGTAPMLQCGASYHENLTYEKVDKLIEKYKSEARLRSYTDRDYTNTL
jgi:hypothetical protein